MSDDRPTVRPVTLARLIEVTYLCGESATTTDDIEKELEVSHRRARSVLLETERIGYISQTEDDTYTQTPAGASFVGSVEDENWPQVSSLLEIHSPHYGAFLNVIENHSPIELDQTLHRLTIRGEETPYTYNQTSIEVLGDWGQRLGTVQRNAFTGEYYLSRRTTVPTHFDDLLLKAYDELEETAGVGMRQRHLSIPELREMLCSWIGATRDAVDDALCAVAQQNVGKVELSGAPMDTGAKDATYGIKEMRLADDSGLISTAQSTERIMAGVEQFGKRYYYLTVHDDNIIYTQETDQ